MHVSQSGKVKYYRDRATLMDLFNLSRSKWTITRFGDCLVATSSLGNQIWGKTVAEIGDLLEQAGVDESDIKIQL